MFNFTGMRYHLVLMALACFGCDEKRSAQAERHARPTEAQVKRQFMRANEQLLQKENDEIDYYVKTHRVPFIKTSSGIRYHVYRHSPAGDSIRPDMQVSLDYTVSLPDGSVCYSSNTAGRKSLVIEKAEAESGLHRGLQYLKRGDHALLIIPSHLAHGLLGDMDKIPPQTPIIYNVHTF